MAGKGKSPFPELLTFKQNIKMKNKKIILLAIISIIIISIISITEGKQKIMQNFENITDVKSNVITLTDENFNDIVLNSNKPVVVDFWAPWCGPCKRLSPIIDELADEYGDKIKFGKLNVDENENLSSEYQITSIPHLIIFNNGIVSLHIIGLHSKSEIEEKLSPILK
jgi:thioredoxin 1